MSLLSEIFLHFYRSFRLHAMLDTASMQLLLLFCSKIIKQRDFEKYFFDRVHPDSGNWDLVVKYGSAWVISSS